MSDETKVKEGAGAAAEMETLANALRFERAKNKVLLDEVIALEDEMVNRCMADFESVVSEETQGFWREQLLTNRELATSALRELATAKAGGGGAAAEGSQGGGAGQGGTRRPLHNRAMTRPAARQGYVGQAAAVGETEDRAAKIRNRAHEISRAERVPFSAAFRRAEREVRGQ
jgi:hypothetical protein